MKKKRLSQSVRKYIRRQKAIIHRMASDEAEEVKLLKELLSRFYKEGAQ